MRVHAIYFSPAGSTKKIVEKVAEGISVDFAAHDITQGLKEDILLDDADVAVVGVPSYSGRVPVLAAQYLSEIEANGAACILACVYGNRAWEDTLLELSQICRKCGFAEISAAAFIARHSIFPDVAADRPNPDDLEQARSFGEESLKLIKGNKRHQINLAGNIPFGEIRRAPFVPETDDRCTQCGLCARLCPTAAIDPTNASNTDAALCISCARCIEYCPVNARKFAGALYEKSQANFKKQYASKKEIELFFPD